MTDGNPSHANLDDYFHGHHSVDDNKEFVRAVIIPTNFAESYQSLLKRGLIGAFHHVSAERLHRYVDEFWFRWRLSGETAKDSGAFASMIDGGSASSDRKAPQDPKMSRLWTITRE